MPPKSRKSADSNLIGPHCSAIGLNKTNLGVPSSVQIDFVSNGVIIELHRLLKLSNCSEPNLLLSWLSPFGLSTNGEVFLDCVSALCQKREHLRRRKRQDDIVQLEREEFKLDKWTPLINSELQPPPPQTEPALPSERDVLMHSNTLTFEINKKKKHIASLEGTVLNLRDEMSEKRKEMGHYGPSNVDRRDARHKMARLERDDMKSQLASLQTQNASLTSKVKDLEETLGDLKAKCHNKQKIVSHYKSTIQKFRRLQNLSCKLCPGLKKVINNLTLEREALEVQLEEVKKEQLTVTTRNGQGTFTPEMRSCVLELVGLEVATGKVRDVIKAVSSHVFGVQFCDDDLPSKSTCQKIADEGHAIAKQYIGQRMKESSSWGLHKDGTTRRKVKILDTAICLDNGETLSLGFSTVASETGQAIATDSIKKLEEVEAEDKDSLSKLHYTMSDRAANEKKSNAIFAQWRDNITRNNSVPAPKLKHFFCMAHVLLGFHNKSVKVLKGVQNELAENGRMGRDCHPRFKTYRMFEAAPRLCVSVSNAFAPVGDHLGVRDIWNAYCLENNIQSLIKNYKDNRFNALFHTSAATIYHHQHFLHILQNITNPNKKLQALQKDLEDENLMVIIKTLAIMYIKVTDPFWTLVTSKLSYLQIQPIIKQLHSDLQHLTQTPQSIVTDTSIPPLQRYMSQSQLYNIIPSVQEIDAQLETVLSTLIHSFLTLMNRQLDTYITQPLTSEDIEATSFAPATNLVCERNFGDLDSSQHRRPSATMHHHTTVHLLKRSREKLSKWVGSMKSEQKTSLFKEARKLAPELRKQHQTQFKEELKKSLDKIKPDQRPPRQRTEQMMEEEDDDSDEDVAGMPDIDVTVGDWVAVAYPDGWYPGLVEGIVDSDDMFDNNFGHWCSNKRDLKWPDGKDRHPASTSEVYTDNGISFQFEKWEKNA